MKSQTQQSKEEILTKFYISFNFGSSQIFKKEVIDFLSQSLDRLEKQVRQETIEEIYSKSKELTTICPYGNAHKARLAEGELMAVMIIKDKLSVSEEKEGK